MKTMLHAYSLQNAKTSPRTKHIGLPYHWFRNKVSFLEIDIQAVSSADQLADQFTKELLAKRSLKAQESSLWDGECTQFSVHIYI